MHRLIWAITWIVVTAYASLCVAAPLSDYSDKLVTSNEAVSGDQPVFEGGSRVTVSASGDYVYGVVSDGILVFRIEGDGTMKWIETKKQFNDNKYTFIEPRAVTTTSQGNFVLVASKFESGTSGNTYHAVVVFSVNDDGTLSFVSKERDGKSSFTDMLEPSDIAISPNDDFVYITGEESNSVAVASLATDGTLTFLESQTPADTMVQPQRIIIDPAGNHLYVTGYGDGSVTRFTINDDGTLTFKKSYQLTHNDGDLTRGFDMAMTSSQLYVTSRKGYIAQYNVNSRNGALTFVQSSRVSGVRNIALFHDNLFATAIRTDTVATFYISQDDGTLEDLRSLGGSFDVSGAQDVAQSLDYNTLYVMTETDLKVMTIHSSPIVQATTPVEVNYKGGTEVVITGENFPAGRSSESQVTIDGASATILDSSDTEITFRSPAHALGGPFDIMISSSLEDGLSRFGDSHSVTFMEALHVASVSPSSGSYAGGVKLTLSGNGFGASEAQVSVKVKDIDCTVDSVEDTLLICTTGPSNDAFEGPVDIVVTAADLTTTCTDCYEFNTPSLFIDSVRQFRCPTGYIDNQDLVIPLLVRGEGFDSSTEPLEVVIVTDSGVETPCSIDQDSLGSTSFMCSPVDPLTETYTLYARFENGNGNAGCNADCSFQYAPAYVSSVTPAQGSYTGGEKITLTGCGFTDEEEAFDIKINGAACEDPVMSLNQTQLVCTTAAYESTGSYSVITTIEGAVAGGNVQFALTEPGVYISSISSQGACGVIGTTVVVEGEGFVQSLEVLVDDKPCSRTSFTSTRIKCKTAETLEEGSHTASFSSDNEADELPQCSSVCDFQVHTEYPTVDSISPNSGSFAGGVEVTVSGTRIATVRESNRVLFGDMECVMRASDDGFPVDDSRPLICTTPDVGESALGSVEVTLEVNGVSSCACTDCYTAEEPTVEVTRISRCAGSADENGEDTVFIRGSGFRHDSDGLSSNVVTVDGQFNCNVTAASFGELECSVETLQAGNHTLTIDVDGVSNGYPNCGLDGVNCAFETSDHSERPILSSIEPTTGSSLGGTLLTVHGSGFDVTSASATRISLGSSSCALDTAASSSTKLICETMAGSIGSSDVLVTVEGRGTACPCIDCFDYQHPGVTVTSVLVDDQSHCNTAIVLFGDGFHSSLVDNRVTVQPGDINCVIDEASGTNIKCHTVGRLDVGDYLIEIEVVGASNGNTNCGTNNVNCKFTAEFVEPQATITSVPTESITWAGGSRVTIQGCDFSNDPDAVAVKVAGVKCEVAAASDREVTCFTSPANDRESKNVDVSITVDGQVSSEPSVCDGCVMQVSPIVTVAAAKVLLCEVSTGTGVEIVAGGTGDDADKVSVTLSADGVASMSCTIESLADGVIICQTRRPLHGLTDYNVNVYVDAVSNGNSGCSASDEEDCLLQVPESAGMFGITQIAPTEGSDKGGGEMVEITGCGFTDDVSVTVGGVSCVVEDVSATLVQCSRSKNNAGEPGRVDVSAVVPTYTNPAVCEDCFILLQSPVAITASSATFYTGSRGQTTFQIEGRGFCVTGDHSCTNTIFIKPPTGDAVECVTETAHATDLSCSTDVELRPGLYTIDIFVEGVSDGYTDCGLDGTACEIRIEAEKVLVTHVEPSSGSWRGGTRITLTGDRFSTVKGENGVTVGGRPCEVVSSFEKTIECITTESESYRSTGNVKVEVVGIEFDGLCERCYTYLEPSVRVDATLSTAGKSSTKINIWGSNFRFDSKSSNEIDIVSADDPSLAFECKVLRASYGELTCETEDPLAQGDYTLDLHVDGVSNGATECGKLGVSCGVIVSDDAGDDSEELTHVLIRNVEPNQGSKKGGTTVFIEGNNFDEDAAKMMVSIGGVDCVVIETSSTSLSCRIEDHPGDVGFASVVVRLTYHSEPGICSSCFEWVEPALLVENVGFTYGDVTEVDVWARGVDGDDPLDSIDVSLLLAGATEKQRCQVTEVEVGHIHCSMETKLSSGDYSVNLVIQGVSNGDAECGDNGVNCALEVTSTPSISELTIDSLTPTSGSWVGGTSVTIKGSGFSDVTGLNIVTIGGVDCQVQSASVTSTQLVCVTGSNDHVSGAYNVIAKIDGTSHEDICGSCFDYVEPTVLVEYTDVESGDGGSVIHLWGRGLDDSDSERLLSITPIDENKEPSGDAIPCNTFISASAGQLKCQLETDLDLGSYVVSLSVTDVSNGLTECGSDDHNCEAVVDDGTDDNKVRIHSVSPSSGSRWGGTEVTIVGEGFGFGANTVSVKIGGVKCDVAESVPQEIVCVTGPDGETGSFNVLVDVHSSDEVKQGICSHCYDYIAGTVFVTSITANSLDRSEITIWGKHFSPDTSDDKIQVTAGNKRTHLYDGDNEVDSATCSPYKADPGYIMCRTPSRLDPGKYHFTVTVSGVSNGAAECGDDQSNCGLELEVLKPVVLSLESSTKLSELPTAGDSVVTVNGQNFGRSLKDVHVTYGPTGVEFLAADCEITHTDTVVVCSTLAGSGSSHAWVVTVKGKSSEVSEDVTSYAVPKVSSVSVGHCSRQVSCGGISGLGGDRITLEGVNFDPRQNAVTVKYGRDSDPARYQRYTCTDVVVESTTKLSCVVSPGGGSNQRFRVTNVGPTSQSNNPDEEEILISYGVPLVESVTSLGLADCDHNTLCSGFDTNGGSVVTLTGTNFDSSGTQTNPRVQVNYGPDPLFNMYTCEVLHVTGTDIMCSLARANDTRTLVFQVTNTGPGPQQSSPETGSVVGIRYSLSTGGGDDSQQQDSSEHVVAEGGKGVYLRALGQTCEIGESAEFDDICQLGSACEHGTCERMDLAFDARGCPPNMDERELFISGFFCMGGVLRRLRDPGEKCQYNAQCKRGECSSHGRCIEVSRGKGCTPGDGIRRDCEEGYFCSSIFSRCVQEKDYGERCENQPEHGCKTGLVCDKTHEHGAFQCLPEFSRKVGDYCAHNSPHTGRLYTTNAVCKWGLSCERNTCTQLISNTPCEDSSQCSGLQICGGTERRPDRRLSSSMREIAGGNDKSSTEQVVVRGRELLGEQKTCQNAYNVECQVEAQEYSECLRENTCFHQPTLSATLSECAISACRPKYNAFYCCIANPARIKTAGIVAPSWNVDCSEHTTDSSESSQQVKEETISQASYIDFEVTFDCEGDVEAWKDTNESQVRNLLSVKLDVPMDHVKIKEVKPGGVIVDFEIQGVEGIDNIKHALELDLEKLDAVHFRVIEEKADQVVLLETHFHGRRMGEEGGVVVIDSTDSNGSGSDGYLKFEMQVLRVETLDQWTNEAQFQYIQDLGDVISVPENDISVLDKKPGGVIVDFEIAGTKSKNAANMENEIAELWKLNSLSNATHLTLLEVNDGTDYFDRDSSTHVKDEQQSVSNIEDMNYYVIAGAGGFAAVLLIAFAGAAWKNDRAKSTVIRKETNTKKKKETRTLALMLNKYVNDLQKKKINRSFNLWKRNCRVYASPSKAELMVAKVSRRRTAEVILRTWFKQTQANILKRPFRRWHRFTAGAAAREELASTGSLYSARHYESGVMDTPRSYTSDYTYTSQMTPRFTPRSARGNTSARGNSQAQFTSHVGGSDLSAASGFTPRPYTPTFSRSPAQSGSGSGYGFSSFIRPTNINNVSIPIPPESSPGVAGFRVSPTPQQQHQQQVEGDDSTKNEQPSLPAVPEGIGSPRRRQLREGDYTPRASGMSPRDTRAERTTMDSPRGMGAPSAASESRASLSVASFSVASDGGQKKSVQWSWNPLKRFNN